jgi:hypothetical protein
MTDTINVELLHAMRRLLEYVELEESSYEHRDCTYAGAADDIKTVRAWLESVTAESAA